MRRFSAIVCLRPAQAAALVLLLLLSPGAHTHETGQQIPDPGFRPQSELATAFLQSLDTATIAVYPTIIRRATRTAHSFASQEQIIAMLNEDHIAIAVAAPRRVDLGRLAGRSQWALFENDMRQIAESLKAGQSDAHYHLFMEFLLPVDDQTIFGIECYVLDRDGENAFSFLLNSHHQLFVDAKLSANDTSEAARARLMERATRVGLTALKAQIKRETPPGES